MKTLVVMSSNHETLFRKCFEEYSACTGEKIKFFIIPSGVKGSLNCVEYLAFKNNWFGHKEKYYERLRKNLIRESLDCDKIVFYNIFKDNDYFVSEYVCQYLRGKKCYIAFADPMREVCEDFLHWNIFSKIYCCEFQDVEGYAKEHGLKVKFIPGGTKYFFRDNSPMPAKYDVCFVGLGTKERLRYLDIVAEHCYKNGIKLFVAGHFWHNSNCFNAWIGKHKFVRKHPFLSKYVVNRFIDPQDLFDIYRQSKICLNINISGHSTFNNRNFDIMYAGSTVLTEKEDMSGYDIVENEHYYACSSPEEMTEKIDMLLADEEKLVTCRKRAKKLVTEKYTFLHAIEEYLKD